MKEYEYSGFGSEGKLHVDSVSTIESTRLYEIVAKYLNNHRKSSVSEL